MRKSPAERFSHCTQKFQGQLGLSRLTSRGGRRRTTSNFLFHFFPLLFPLPLSLSTWLPPNITVNSITIDRELPLSRRRSSPRNGLRVFGRFSCCPRTEGKAETRTGFFTSFGFVHYLLSFLFLSCRSQQQQRARHCNSAAPEPQARDHLYTAAPRAARGAAPRSSERRGRRKR